MFVGSEDVLVQLPEDSQRFDAIDERWRNLMKIATDQPIVIESCCVEGRDKLLESLKKDLEHFLSNTALLDLLSNGNNPQKVQAHMGDCFDNIRILEYEKVCPRTFQPNTLSFYRQEMVNHRKTLLECTQNLVVNMFHFISHFDVKVLLKIGEME